MAPRLKELGEIPLIDATGGGGAPAANTIRVRKDSAGADFTRPRLNFITGSGTSLTVADDSLGDEVDITVAATGGAANTVEVRKNSAGSVFTRPRLNFIEGSGATLTVADDAGNDEVDITIAATGGGGGMGTLKWEAAAITTLGSTTLNSLAANTGVVTAEYDNSNTANLHLFGEFELVADYGANIPTAEQLVEAYFVQALDGTNYADGTTTVTAITHRRFAFSVRAVTGVQRIVVSGVTLPPTKFKVQLINATDQAWAASGNTLKMIPYREQNV